MFPMNITLSLYSSHKREYNSDRRRKLSLVYQYKYLVKIRENITPIGDGNLKKGWGVTNLSTQDLNKREYNSDRRRKLVMTLVSALNTIE